MSEEIRVDIVELHPGFGEWGQAVGPRRGFDVEKGGPNEIFRAQGLLLPARPVKDDHIIHNGVDYVVNRVTWEWVVPIGSRSIGHYTCVVHCSYNGGSERT